MDKEQLKIIAGEYFKDQIGGEPDTLKFICEDHEAGEFLLKVTFSKRVFEIWMLPLHNQIELTEKRHKVHSPMPPPLPEWTQISITYKKLCV